MIRRWIRLLDQHEFDRTVGSQILCACSGGSDSLALTLLLTKYGARLGRVGAILHFNHGWRGAESDSDEQRVVELAREFSIPLIRGKGTHCPRGESPEAHARSERLVFFRKALASRPGARVWTAHHADDLAETLLWRILTGARHSHGEGIRVFDPDFARSDVRPCLTTRKAELRDFLEEEGREWSEDRTNHEGDLLRARLRRDALPALDAIFPKWRSHLVDEALERQRVARGGDSSPGGLDALASLLTSRGIRVRRAHLEAMAAALASSVRRSIDLEGGWRLTHEKNKLSGKSRWILE